jgi:hypothetical protein
MLTSPGHIAEFFGLEQVGIFRSNIHNLEDFSKILYTLIVKVFSQENLRVVVEYNTYGSELIKNLQTLYPASNDFDEETIVRYYHRVGAKVKNLGLRLNRDNKILYCEKMKKSVGLGQLIVKDPRTIEEAKAFSRNPNGSYSAQSGNDDCIMTCVSASSFFETLDFMEIVEDIFDDLDSSVQKRIDEMLDFDDENNGDSMYDGLF